MKYNEEFNPLTIHKTRKYLKEEKNKRYYPYSGLETYLGYQRRRKNFKCSKKNKKINRRIP